ncbi:MAG: pyridoxamine 5'-phosphate oxidase, partial [Acidimicrobiia bacterium]|nr:pyridoxamine 5'-phosphate oxidase [Acidimicrobiia bacterium]
MDLVGQRREYETRGINEADMALDPFLQFTRWMDDAQASGTAEPTAAILATADAHGRPSARTVLLKDVSDGGFVVYTNYDSRKGRETAVNPWAALTFVWLELSRQVRIEGPVERLTPDESDAYFATRPRGSQIGAWASPQSHVIADRADLEERVLEVEQRFAGDEVVPRPPNWGGLRVIPVEIELWQGRSNRLHDRLVYGPAEGQPQPAPGSPD